MRSKTPFFIGIVLVVALAHLSAGVVAAADVSNVVANQRSDGSMIVDISYDLVGSPSFVGVEASDDGGATWTLPITAISGDIGEAITPGNGKQIVWNCSTDIPGAQSSFVVRVCATRPAPSGMAIVPAGEFLMGDHFNEGDGDEFPVHAVYVDTFAIAIYEVTNQNYAESLNWALTQAGQIEIVDGVVYQAEDGVRYCTTNSAPAGSPDFGEFSRITWNGSTFGVLVAKENHPMANISWFGAAAFANWRSVQDGRTPCYDSLTWECDFNANGYRLPTEAEWEKAARGGNANPYIRFPWGDTLDGSNGNYGESGDPFESQAPPFTTPVGFYDGAQVPIGVDMANGFGLYDVVGNVIEWCNDWWDYSYYARSLYDNPRGPGGGSFKVLRGGSWPHPPSSVRTAKRHLNSPSYLNDTIGFRLASSVRSCDYSPPFLIDNTSQCGWQLRDNGSGPSSRRSGYLAFDSLRQTTVMFGGHGNGTFFNDTWEWDGEGWLFRDNGQGIAPPKRFAHALAYDDLRGVTVLFGGTDETGGNSIPHADTWEWDGSQWTQESMTGPSARWWHAMAFDSTRGVTVLHGGQWYGSPIDETWEWDGVEWLLRSTNGPGPRSLHAMAFDSSRGVTVLFGGYATPFGTPNAETWEWNGQTWALRSIGGPSARHSLGMAFDSASNRVVLHGGWPFDEATWEWDGTSWSMRASDGPGERQIVGMTFDSVRDRVVLFGGLSPVAEIGDLWELPSLDPNDCNCNGVDNLRDIISGASQDCNANGIPDDCDIASALSQDCDANGIPDECLEFSRSLDFDLSITGTVLDTNGQGTGFTHRLPGTGGSLPPNDPNLDLLNMPGKLTFTSTHSDINGQANLGELEAIGFSVPVDGDRDLTAVARFEDIDLTGGSTQLSIFAGSMSDRVLRVSLHEGGHYFFTENYGGGDYSPWLSPPNSFSNGDSVQVTLTRLDGLWQLTWQNETTPSQSGLSPSFSLPWLDSEPNLVVGILYSNAGGLQPRTSRVDSFTVSTNGGTADCNENGVPDACDVTSGLSLDCNQNGVPDECDISSDNSQDCNTNDIPDECDGPPLSLILAAETQVNGKLKLFVVEGTGPLQQLAESPPSYFQNYPIDLAFSPWNELFVSNFFDGTISRFVIDHAGILIPNGVITVDPADYVIGIAFRSTGELFAVGYFDGLVYRFAFDVDKNVIPNGTFSTTCSPPSIDLSFNASGEMFLTCGPPPVHRFVFDGTDNVVPNGSLDIPGAANLHFTTVSDANELFIGDISSHKVFRFLFDELGDPVANGSIDVPNAIGMAFSLAGELFVSRHDVDGGIHRFLFDGEGNAIPNGSIETSILGGIAVAPFPVYALEDCNSNAVPDECELINGNLHDCQPNTIPDECELAEGMRLDCNKNMIPDECDISSGASADVNGNQVPDVCEIGGCCVANACTNRTEWDCINVGGNFLGEGVACTFVCATGACCRLDGTCVFASTGSCLSMQGSYFGGSSCASVLSQGGCPEPVGACCSTDGSCIQDIESSCQTGTWLLGTSCNSGPCVATPLAIAVGSRYLAVTVEASSATPVALRVTSPEFPCLTAYVDPNGLLLSSPTYQSPSAWGTVYVGDDQIVPQTSYVVTADNGTTSADSALITTWHWGDTNHNGVVNLDDILCVLAGFGGDYATCSLYANDQIGAHFNPDRVVNLDDILAVLSAFSGLVYSASSPCS